MLKQWLVIVLWFPGLAAAQAQFARVPTGAMEPTLLTGDRLRIETAAQYFRGDVVVVRFQDLDATEIKRLIGLPGDHVRLENKILILNGRRVNEKNVVYRGPDDADVQFYFLRNFPLGAEKLPATTLSSAGREMLDKDVRNGELVVPGGNFFLMGDNRDYSLDSRMQGLVPASMILGLAREIVSSEDPETKQARPGRTMIPIERSSLPGALVK